MSLISSQNQPDQPIIPSNRAENAENACGWFNYNSQGLTPEQMKVNEAAVLAFHQASPPSRFDIYYKSIWNCIKNCDFHFTKHMNQIKADLCFKQFMKQLQSASGEAPSSLQHAQNIIETIFQKTLTDFVDKQKTAEAALKSGQVNQQDIENVNSILLKEKQLLDSLNEIINTVRTSKGNDIQEVDDSQEHFYKGLLDLQKACQSIFNTHTTQFEKIQETDRTQRAWAEHQAALQQHQAALQQAEAQVAQEEAAVAAVESPPTPPLPQEIVNALKSIELRQFESPFASALKKAAKHLAHPKKIQHHQPKLKKSDYSEHISKELASLNAVATFEPGNEDQIKNWTLFYAKICVVDQELHPNKLEGLFENPHLINILEKGVRLFGPMASQNADAAKIAKTFQSVSDKYHCYQLAKNPETYKETFKSKHSDFAKLNSILLENADDNAEHSYEYKTKMITSKLEKIKNLINANKQKYQSHLDKVNDKSNVEMVTSWFKLDNEMKLVQEVFSEMIADTIDRSLDEMVPIFNDMNHPNNEFKERFLNFYEGLHSILQHLPSGGANVGRKERNENFKFALTKKGIQRIPNKLPSLIQELNTFLLSSKEKVQNSLSKHHKPKQEVVTACRALTGILEQCNALCAQNGAIDEEAIGQIAQTFSQNILEISNLLRVKCEESAQLSPKKYEKKDFKVGKEDDAARTPSRVYFPQVLMRIVMLSKELEGQLTKQSPVNQPLVDSLHKLIVFFNVHIKQSISPFGENPTGGQANGEVAAQAMSVDLQEYLTPEGAIKPQFLCPDGSIKAWKDFMRA